MAPQRVFQQLSAPTIGKAGVICSAAQLQCPEADGPTERVNIDIVSGH